MGGRAWSGELSARGHHVNRKRVARLMREAGLQGVSRRQSAPTTRRDRDAPAAPDLVDRDLAASGPDALWVADITYVPTGSGFLYLAVVLDAWSRRVVGWAMASHLLLDRRCFPTHAVAAGRSSTTSRLGTTVIADTRPSTTNRR